MDLIGPLGRCWRDWASQRTSEISAVVNLWAWPLTSTKAAGLVRSREPKISQRPRFIQPLSCAAMRLLTIRSHVPTAMYAHALVSLVSHSLTAAHTSVATREARVSRSSAVRPSGVSPSPRAAMSRADSMAFRWPRPVSR